MNRKIIFAALILCVLLFQQCRKSVLGEEQVDELLPLTRIVLYDPEVADIIDFNCSACHSGSSPSASLDLSNYQNAVAAMQNGEMRSRLNNSSSPMPPTGKLTPSILQIIEKWSSDGYPEN